MEAQPTQPSEQPAFPNPQLLLQFLTTEHFTLQTGRSGTIGEANGRCSLYMSAVSGSLIALAFIGQMSALGEAFFVFGFVLLPSVLFLGWATFVRVLQLGLEDMVYARGINRIRHFYVELAPEMERYFILSTHDDTGSASLRHLGLALPWWQVFMTAAGVVEVINGVVAGVLAGMAAHQLAGLTLLPSTGAGIVAFVSIVTAQHAFSFRYWEGMERHITDLFPPVQESASRGV